MKSLKQQLHHAHEIEHLHIKQVLQAQMARANAERALHRTRTALAHHRAFLSLLTITNASGPIITAAREQLRLSDFMPDGSLRSD